MKASQVIETFEKSFGKNYRLFKAPGRINLIGEHTDYNLGYVMPGAIDKYIFLAIRENNSMVYRIHAANIGQKTEFTSSSQIKDLPGWARYPAGVIREFSLMGHTIRGFDAVFGGDIPEGAGLSSSAALESVFGVALNQLNAVNLTMEEIAKVGQRAEHNSVGVKCGIMDQFASIFGRENQLIRLDCRDLTFEYYPFKTDGYTLLLADTMVKHSLASSAYNERREQCENGIKIISAKYNYVQSLRDVDLNMTAGMKSALGPLILKRCEYVVEENIRLEQVCQALNTGDIESAGKYIYGSHNGLRDKYEVSCPELDFLVETAAATSGVLGARMMGGGFGGCTINLLKASAKDNFREYAERSYNQRFGKSPNFYEVSISDGAGEIYL